MKKIIAALAALVGGFFIWRKLKGGEEPMEDTEYTSGS